jgi:hypothetical protein
MRIPKILGAIIVVVPASVLLTAQVSLSEPAAPECKKTPGGATPPGSHWYYRINHADKQHCWYLGVAGAHVAARGAVPAAPDAAPVQQTADVMDAAADDAATAATPAQTAAAIASPSAARPPIAQPMVAQPTMAQAFAPPSVAPPPLAPAIALQPMPSDDEARMNFTARWPNGLAAAQDLSEPQSAASDSYAERHDPADAGAQMPLQWPGAGAGKAHEGAPGTAGETALRYFSIAGVVTMPFLVFAGWAAGFARQPRPSPLGERFWTVARRLRPRAVASTIADGVPTATVRRGGFAPRTPMPTDPADDLKTSLAELMGDLRRAAGEPMPVSARPVARAARGGPGWADAPELADA